MRMMLLGPPGSGKGTQGERLAAALDVPRLSTGDVLRAAVRAETGLGMLARTTMEAGGLVSDEIVIGIVEQRLRAAASTAGFLFDGFPRTSLQARALDQVLERLDQAPLDCVIHLDVPDDEVLLRLLGRSASEQRVDDREEIIRERLRVYHLETRPLITYYRHQGKLTTVAGVGAPDAVYERIWMALTSSVAN